ncbi:MAG TPA: carboxylesterase family protein [Streptosporangiaceae bacterium]|nr:carboxylesterase family protein [Streptosporangiaceae bacterium]
MTGAGSASPGFTTFPGEIFRAPGGRVQKATPIAPASERSARAATSRLGRARGVHHRGPGGVQAAALTTARTSRSQHHARITLFATGNARGTTVCGLRRRPGRDHHRRRRPRLDRARGLRLPRAALRRSPTGNLRWRPPRLSADWQGVRDATRFAPSCPQPQNPALTGPTSEDCLYLNVYTPTVRSSDEGGLPVLVWIHGGGLVQDGGRNYDGTKLAATGAVVVTINYRLGALGFLAHPALASHGAAGNYGLMDQQAALRWVQRNIAQFGGDPRNVTIAGQSAGGLSVLAQMVSPGARGLFQKAIVQSGTFALNQRPLAAAEAAGETFAKSVGCADQTAACLRSVPVSDLVSKFGVEIPGVVDGSVLTQPIGTALARGQFARVPVINGITHDEELLFVAGLGITVSQGTNIPLAGDPTDPANYQANIAQALGVSDKRAAAIANEYPLSAYPNPVAAFSLLVSDASFACPALQVDRWTAVRGVPTYAYQFNDDNAPLNILPPDQQHLGLSTHGTELPYLFDQPNAPFPVTRTLTPDQQALAASMRTAWASFAGTGNPSTRALSWPSVGNGTKVLSFVPLQSKVTTDFAAAHHCSFWAAG